MIRNSLISAACVITTTACATSPVLRQQCYNPDVRLARLLQPYQEMRAKDCTVGESIDRGGAECDRLEREIATLGVICSAHAPTLMANAVIAYDKQRPADAQQMLDVILSQPHGYPDAAALRARIAIEEGNVPFAQRLLQQQIRLVPDHAGLHEAYAAALYLGGKMSEARAELTLAGLFGAPRWRIAYHLGLIEEALGLGVEASRFYAEALQGNPGWALADSRLKALRARATVAP